jgi:hypothetical protein
MDQVTDGIKAKTNKSQLDSRQTGAKAEKEDDEEWIVGL